MNLTINYKSAEALALCCRLIEEVYDDNTVFNFWGDNCEILNCLAKLAKHMDLEVPGLMHLLGGELEEAKKEIEEEINRPPPF
jgi:hypothetical protein